MWAVEHKVFFKKKFQIEMLNAHLTAWEVKKEKPLRPLLNLFIHSSNLLLRNNGGCNSSCELYFMNSVSLDFYWNHLHSSLSLHMDSQLATFLLLPLLLCLTTIRVVY